MISTARNILETKSRDRERMRLYANHVEQLHIVLFTQRSQSSEGEIHDGNLHIYPTHSRNKFTIVLDAFQIGRKLAKQKRQTRLIISAQDPLWTGWLAWMISKVRNTELHIQLHGDYFGPGWSKHSVRRKIAQSLISILLRRTPAIRVVSERIKQSLLKQGIQEKKITVLPIRPELERFLERTHTPKEKPPYTLLFIGRFAPEKDVERILEAFRVVYEKRKDISLRLVGQGELKDAYIAYIKKHNLEQVVTIEEWNENVPEVMVNADVFLLASKHEAYGLVLLEAMAVGLPIITTDVGCVGELLKDKEHGLVVYENGVAAYARTIESLLNDPDQLRLYGTNSKKTAQAISVQTMDDYVNEWVKSLTQTQ